MVKRPKTPKTDVTGKLLIIFKPYPNADCLVEEDKIALARWVAEVINKDHIVTIWNRPNTKSLIMVEVLKETEYKSFLGEHRWADFLKNPHPDEIDNVSQVFYSAYRNGYEARKKGWKQVDVQEFWFEGFRRSQGAVKQPYPETRWCSVPSNTAHDVARFFCRPLPVTVRRRPAPVKAPVPGSDEYASARGLPTPTTTSYAESSSRPATGNQAAMNKSTPKTSNTHDEDITRQMEREAFASARHMQLPHGSPSSSGMFTNAHIERISGSTFLNVAHIYESSSPASGGGTAFPIAMMGLQAISFATRSHHHLHCDHLSSSHPLLIPEATSSSELALRFLMPHQDIKTIFGPLTLWFLMKIWIQRRAVGRY